MRVALMVLSVAALASGDDSGVPPRRQASDYPAHETLKGAVIAAAAVPQDQAKKMFSGEIAKKYIVVEVAVYPEAGKTFEVDNFDFSLKAGEQVLRTSHPGDVAVMWSGYPDPVGRRGPSVSTETGVMVERGQDPITGRPRTSVGTYEGVAVSNYPQPTAPPPPPNSRQIGLEDKLQRMALPQGPTRDPVAGYLYFRIAGKQRAPLTLDYAKDDASAELQLQK